MLTFFGLVLNWLTSGPLDRILSSIDKHTDAPTERERIRTEAVQAYVQAQVSLANSRQWFFPLFLLLPTAFHYAAVNVYSVLWCTRCAFPVSWTIAALPEPFSQWEGLIVTSLFIGNAGTALISRLRK